MGKNRAVLLTSGDESLKHLAQLRDSAARARDNLRQLADEGNPMALLYQIKFNPVGCDPLAADEPLNLIEQVNQIFTYYASFKAAALLFKWHDGLRELTLNLGTQPGSDIESGDCDGIAAEVFAATHPGSNQKLNKDEKKVIQTDAKHKYVFFMCPEYGEKRMRESQGVVVYSLGGKMTD